MTDVMRSSTDWVGSDFQAQVSTQSYAPRPQIDGVQIIDLRLFSDEGGDFCELARFAPGGKVVGLPDYTIAQVSYSFMEPGTIKAWHLHERQDDLWFVPPSDRALVGLLDVRPASDTYNTSMRFALGAGRARLLLIPRGVAHGVANLGVRPLSIIYLINRMFDPDQPDEHRLPFDVLGSDFWQIQPG